MRLKGKNALVTGATSGIGKSVAKSYLQEGARVVVNYHSEDEKKENTVVEFSNLLDQMNRPSSDVAFVNADLVEQSELDALFEEAENRFGPLDVLVNNAGFEEECPSHKLSPDSLRAQLDLNLRSVVQCSLKAIDGFLSNKQPGCIISNTSVHEHIPKPGFLAYSIAKGGVANMTKTLALEYAKDGIRVNSVAPGVVRTKMNDALDDPEVRQETLDHIPMRKIIDPDELAKTFVYLASDDAVSLTGQSVVVDSGLSLYSDFENNWASQ